MRIVCRLFLFAAIPLVVIPAVIWIIASNDQLFRRTVPVEQRLVSRNETIRKKAQQELLGLEAEQKKKVVSRLIPALEQEDAFVKKWAAISLARHSRFSAPSHWRADFSRASIVLKVICQRAPEVRESRNT